MSKLQIQFMQEATPSKQIIQLNSAVSLLLDSTDRQDQQCTEALQNVFDLLLWAQKKNTDTLQQVLNSQILSLLLQKYKHKMVGLVSGMTMLLGNAKEEGLLATHVLQNQLGDRLLRQYLQFCGAQPNIDEEEHLHIFGSLLRAYHRHFTEKTFSLYIDNNRCLLVEICCKFFNCPQEITRTSVMNVLMSLLKLPCMGKVLQIKTIGRHVSCWCRNMCRLLRNELKDFDQQLLVTDEGESEYIIHSINDKIILWEDLSSLAPHLFAPHFHAEIVLPLIVGSFNTNGIPLFTLKFALFIVSKLIPTIARLSLLPTLGSFLFEQKLIQYSDQQLSTAILYPFHLKTLLREAAEEEDEQDEVNVFNNLNQFFMNIFRSKDGRFLECVCVLFFNLLSAVKESGHASEYFITKLGFGVGGSIISQISTIVITHFSAIHTLEITRMLAALMIYVQPAKYFDDQIKNQFIYLYRSAIDETLQTIAKHPEVHSYLAQMLEYDVKTIFSANFSLEPIAKTDAALIFNNQIIENQTLPFFQQIPETAPHTARYQSVKALLLRKLSKRLIEECELESSVERYYEWSKQLEASYIKPGQYLRLPITINSYKCKLEDGKIVIPQCLLLEDDKNLIVGYVEHMKIRIIINFKYKHTNIQIPHKKQKPMININLRRYSSKVQNLQDMKGFILKHIEVSEDYFQKQKNHCTASEIKNLKELLNKSKQCIPEISLI